MFMQQKERKYREANVGDTSERRVIDSKIHKDTKGNMIQKIGSRLTLRRRLKVVISTETMERKQRICGELRDGVLTAER